MRSLRLVLDSFPLSIERLSFQYGIIEPRKKAKICRLREFRIISLKSGSMKPMAPISNDLNSRLQVLLKKDYPDLQGYDFISNISLLDYRLVFLDEIIANANEKNEHVRETVHDVTKSLLYEDQDVQEQLDSRITFGQKVADEVARFGGSWTFILSFVAFMAIWMGLNVVQPFGIAFDKYPFILLNLALSTLAAVQAPLIMMSQNRASDYDRLQARNDYNVNKQSKEEIRLLHEKIDHLVQQDQSDLA